MGTLYDLFKPEQKVRFELDKGNWSEVFSYGVKIDMGTEFKLKNLYSTSFSLYSKLLCVLANGYSKDIKLSYFYDLAQKIYDWCGDDKIIFYDSESFNEIYWKDWMNSYDSYLSIFPYTGSRFVKD